MALLRHPAVDKKMSGFGGAAEASDKRVGKFWLKPAQINAGFTTSLCTPKRFCNHNFEFAGTGSLKQAIGLRAVLEACPRDREIGENLTQRPAATLD